MNYRLLAVEEMRPMLASTLGSVIRFAMTYPILIEGGCPLSGSVYVGDTEPPSPRNQFFLVGY